MHSEYIRGIRVKRLFAVIAGIFETLFGLIRTAFLSFGINAPTGNNFKESFSPGDAYYPRYSYIRNALYFHLTFHVVIFGLISKTYRLLG